MVIRGMLGLGDNIYQRAVVREIKDKVYLYTPWPQIYSDLDNIFPVRPVTKLRTQNKNMRIQSRYVWNEVHGVVSKKIFYNSHDLQSESMLQIMEKCVGVKAIKFDLPKYASYPVSNKKPYVVVRPTTIRREWRNEARNPKDIYITMACEILKNRGYVVVSVADELVNEEWITSEIDSDIQFHKGELVFEDLMALIENAAIVVGGVGWIVPATIAYQVPSIIILGGQGGHNSPDKIVNYRMGIEKIYWIFPDNYCMCTNKSHKCTKDITDFEGKFNRILDKL